MNSAPAPERSRDPKWRAGFEQLAEHKLSFEATCYDHQLGEIAELAREYPEQPVVLCHAGTPIAVGGPFGGLGNNASERDAIREAWQEGMATLVECSKVTIKLSGLVMPCCGFGFERRETPPGVSEVVDAIGPLITFLIESFGAERCMFASNFPVDKVSMPYETLFDAYKEIAQSLSSQDQQQLFRETALRCYRIEER